MCCASQEVARMADSNCLSMIPISDTEYVVFRNNVTALFG